MISHSFLKCSLIKLRYNWEGEGDVGDKLTHVEVVNPEVCGRVKVKIKPTWNASMETEFFFLMVLFADRARLVWVKVDVEVVVSVEK